jgi:hypothetical protein
VNRRQARTDPENLRCAQSVFWMIAGGAWPAEPSFSTLPSSHQEVNDKDDKQHASDFASYHRPPVGVTTPPPNRRSRMIIIRIMFIRSHCCASAGPRRLYNTPTGFPGRFQQLGLATCNLFNHSAS